MAEIIKVDGTRVPLTDTSLEALQAAVGGYIEIVKVGKGKLLVMDEEGKMKGKPVNDTASKLYGYQHDHIVGDVVIATDAEID